MYCTNCGKEIDEDVKFCPHCGTSVEKTTVVPSPAPTGSPKQQEDKPAKVWTVFSKIGKILGIVCFSTSFIPYLNYISFLFGIPGIVFSCLGRKAKTEVTDNDCRLGLSFSIAAVVIGFVTMIAYYVLFIVMLTSPY